MYILCTSRARVSCNEKQGEYNHWIKKGQGRLVLALKKENTREFSRKEYLGTHIEGSVILQII